MYDELTEVDIQKMKDEIDYRTLQLRPKLIEDVQTARAFGDLSENFEYKCAKQEKNRNDARVRYLQRMIKTAHVIDDTSAADAAGLWDTVEIRMETTKTIAPMNAVSFSAGRKTALDIAPSLCATLATSIPSAMKYDISSPKTAPCVFVCGILQTSFFDVRLLCAGQTKKRTASGVRMLHALRSCCVSATRASFFFSRSRPKSQAPAHDFPLPGHTSPY